VFLCVHPPLWRAWHSCVSRGGALLQCYACNRIKMWSNSCLGVRHMNLGCPSHHPSHATECCLVQPCMSCCQSEHAAAISSPVLASSLCWCVQVQVCQETISALQLTKQAQERQILVRAVVFVLVGPQSMTNTCCGTAYSPSCHIYSPSGLWHTCTNSCAKHACQHSGCSVGRCWRGQKQCTAL